MVEEAKITFLVFTYNEESRVEFILRCIQEFGEIVVIDNCSKDKTLDIAARYTNALFTHKNPGYIENEETMSFALSKAKTKWVYLTYVDELLPKPLLKRIVELSAQDHYKIIEIYRKDFMFGQEVFNYGKHHLRMFVPGTVDFKDNIVHKLGRYLVPKDQVCKIRASDVTSIWHFSSYNLSRLELSHSRYADIEAKQRYEILGQKFSGIRALWRLMFHFWGTYIGLGGFRGGWPGFFISLQRAYFKFSIDARLWEMDHQITLESIEREYNRLKEKLINQ